MQETIFILVFDQKNRKKTHERIQVIDLQNLEKYKSKSVKYSPLKKQKKGEKSKETLC